MRTRLALAAAATLSLVSAPAAMAAGEDDLIPGAGANVVIASGDDAHLVDSLAAGPLSAELGGSLLLTPTDGDLALPITIGNVGVSFLTGYEGDAVWIIGGPAAVSDEVALDIRAATPEGVPVFRLGGATRYETAGLISTVRDELARGVDLTDSSLVVTIDAEVS